MTALDAALPYAREIGALVVLLALAAVYLVSNGTSTLLSMCAELIPQANRAPQKVLDPIEWRSFKLIAKDHLSHNTALCVS